MRKTVATGFFALSSLSLAFLATAQDPAPANLIDFGPTESLVIESQSGEHVFQVEVAETLAEQAQGLMYRESLDADAGMLFEFEEPKIATIWMKNTPIPLDILFVRSNGRILKIEHNAQPYKLRSASSEAVVAAVVELNGGRAKDLGILPGDLVRHEFFGTASAE